MESDSDEDVEISAKRRKKLRPVEYSDSSDSPEESKSEDSILAELPSESLDKLAKSNQFKKLKILRKRKESKQAAIEFPSEKKDDFSDDGEGDEILCDFIKSQEADQTVRYENDQEEVENEDKTEKNTEKVKSRAESKAERMNIEDSETIENENLFANLQNYMAPVPEQAKEKAKNRLKRRKKAKKPVDPEIYEKLVEGLRPFATNAELPNEEIIRQFYRVAMRFDRTESRSCICTHPRLKRLNFMRNRYRPKGPIFIVGKFHQFNFPMNFSLLCKASCF